MILVVPNKTARWLADIDAPRFTFPPICEEDLIPLGITGVVENRHTGEERRWTSIHELVLKTEDGKLWRALYERGLTENQEAEPFEWHGPEVEFTQVIPVEVKAVEYRPVASSS